MVKNSYSEKLYFLHSYKTRLFEDVQHSVTFAKYSGLVLLISVSSDSTYFVVESPLKFLTHRLLFFLSK